MLSARIFICLSICPSVCLFGRSIHLSVCLSDNITVCPICLLVPPSVHLSIHTRHPFSLSGRPSVQSVHLSIQTLLISSSVISRGISIQPTEMTGPVKVSKINIPVKPIIRLCAVHRSIQSIRTSVQLVIQSVCRSVYSVHSSIGWTVRRLFSFRKENLALEAVTLCTKNSVLALIRIIFQHYW